jgi:plasmid maintenance system antidote protein VapI
MEDIKLAGFKDALDLAKAALSTVELPYIPAPPGQLIKELATARNISTDLIARRLSIRNTPSDGVAALFKGQMHITDHMASQLASQLELIFGIKKDFWLLKEKEYRQRNGRKHLREALEKLTSTLAAGIYLTYISAIMDEKLPQLETFASEVQKGAEAGTVAKTLPEILQGVVEGLLSGTVTFDTDPPDVAEAISSGFVCQEQVIDEFKKQLRLGIERRSRTAS